MIFQDPFTMLNPLLRCAGHIEEVLRNRATPVPPQARRRREAIARLAEVGITDPSACRPLPVPALGRHAAARRARGRARRRPELLIADEPSTALDVTTQAEILELLKSVQQARGMGLILITHDLRVAFSVADRVYVLYAGSLVEVSDAERSSESRSTRTRLASCSRSRRRIPAGDSLLAIDGSVPAPDEVADQCSFASRCRWADGAASPAAAAARGRAGPVLGVRPARGDPRRR